jgi:hypothetical protein
MTVRIALPGELAEFPTAEAGEAKFVLDADGIKGHIAISRVPIPGGEQCWIHDVHHDGEDPMGLVKLMLRARKQGREWGFTEFFTNVNLDSPLANIWLDHGLELDQLILKGRV